MPDGRYYARTEPESLYVECEMCERTVLATEMGSAESRINVGKGPMCIEYPDAVTLPPNEAMALIAVGPCLPLSKYCKECRAKSQAA